jgi:hypothetical protein
VSGFSRERSWCRWLFKVSGFSREGSMCRSSVFGG